MPYHVEWDSDRAVLICHLYGSVEGEEIAAMVEKAARIVGQPRDGRQQDGESPAGPPDGRLDIFCDARGIHGLMVAPSELDAVVARLIQFARAHPHGRTAIVAARPIDQAMGKLLVLKSLGTTRERKVFADKAEALRWIRPSSSLSQ
jgi:hypothetical protein